MMTIKSSSRGRKKTTAVIRIFVALALYQDILPKKKKKKTAIYMNSDFIGAESGKEGLRVTYSFSWPKFVAGEEDCKFSES